MHLRVCLLLLVLTASIILVLPAEARRWQPLAGQSFEAEFVRVDGANAIFSANGREFQYPVLSLSVPDRLFINRTLYNQSHGNAAAATSPSATPSVGTNTSSSTPVSSANSSNSSLQLAGHSITTGVGNELDVPISDSISLQTVKSAYGKASSTAKMLIALPNDFNPNGMKPWPILIVSATTDGGGSSIGAAKGNYLPDATNKGFVVIALDGEFGHPAGQGDSTDFRWALVSSGLAAINKQWSASKSWPIVTTGISGGGGYASHQAMMLIQKQAPVIGMLLAVTGWNPTDFPQVMQRTPFTPLHNLPVFISAGDSDTIATKEITTNMNKTLTTQGFRNVRFEHFPGGHELYRPHLNAALDWFLEQAGKNQTFKH